MSAMTLYAIEQTLEDLCRARDAAADDGDVAAVKSIDEALAEYLTQEIGKVDSYAGVIRRLEDDAARCDQEADRLARRAKRFRSDVDRLKRNALAAMQRFGLTELKTPTTTIRRCANGGVQPLQLNVAEPLPVGLRKVTVVMPGDAFEWLCSIMDRVNEPHPLIGRSLCAARYDPDSDRIREALKAGQEIAGAKLLPRGEHVRIS